MTADEVAKMLDSVDHTYRLPAQPPEAEKTRLAVWCTMFRDIPHSAAQDAMMRCFATCKYPPVPADLLEIINRKRTASEAELWEIAMRAGKKLSDLRDYIRIGGMTDGHGRHTPAELKKEAEKIFKELPAAVQDWAGTPDALASYNEMDRDALLRFVCPQFNAFIQSARKRGEVDNLTPSGMLIGGNSAAQIAEGST